LRLQTSILEIYNEIMKTYLLIIFCVIVSFFEVIPSYSQSERQSDSLAIQHKKHKHPFPLWIGNIKIGKTKDSIITKRFGSGIFDSEDGHGGARYFLDAKKQVILYTVIGVDNSIEEASLSIKDYPFDFLDTLKKFPNNAISSGFSILSKTDDMIGIGTTEEMVQSLLGTPNREEKNAGYNILYYEDSNDQWKQVIFYQATFTFSKDRLIRMTIYNGE
jgi:hypothetical protein